MKKLFQKVTAAVVIYWVLCAAFLWLATYFKWPVPRRFMLSTFIQFFVGVSTLGAVIASLFGHAIKRRYDRPNLVFDVACDDEHCVLRRDENSTASSFPKAVLEIYTQVKNTVCVEAQDAQLICHKAFVSKDGEHFIRFTNFRAASFRWLYSSEEKKFLTTLRHSVEKYAKVVEIVDQNVMREGSAKPGESSEHGEVVRDIHFEICLSLTDGQLTNIPVGLEYRAVLLSLCLASSSTQPEPYYLKIYLKSGGLDAMPTRDRLEIRTISKEEAQEAVSESLD